ncbi:hypothetical protein, partial [Streptomyces sp. NPDC053720]|uniref:hypothetical protein n=1 Tax=Streptomyces sp. NPDC053720 TaxID=3154855 RepID=UPI00343E89EC
PAGTPNLADQTTTAIQLLAPFEFGLSAELRRNSPVGEFGVISDKPLRGLFWRVEFPVGNS